MTLTGSHHQCRPAFFVLLIDRGIVKTQEHPETLLMAMRSFHDRRLAVTKGSGHHAGY